MECHAQAGEEGRGATGTNRNGVPRTGEGRKVDTGIETNGVPRTCEGKEERGGGCYQD